jgi:hypothetical protein
MSKIIFKSKNFILTHFRVKNILKNNHNYIPKNPKAGEVETNLGSRNERKAKNSKGYLIKPQEIIAIKE